MSVSEECFDLATGLFKNWVLIEAASRHSKAEEKEMAIKATLNAGLSSIKFMEGPESKALCSDLEVVKDALEKSDFASASEKLEDLSEQVFMKSLQQVVECEIAKR